MSEQSSRGPAWERTRLAVLDRDAWACKWCNKPLIGSDATADHWPVPKSQGGTDDMWNLVASCRKCNGIRQDRDLVRTDWFNPRWFAGSSVFGPP